MARSAGLLLAPVKGFGLRLRLFSGKKKELTIMFCLILDHFGFPVVTLVTFSSNLSNFRRIKPKKNMKNPKIQKI